MKILTILLALCLCALAPSAAKAELWFDWKSMGICYDWYEDTTVTLSGKSGPSGYLRREYYRHCQYMFGFAVK